VIAWSKIFFVNERDDDPSRKNDFAFSKSQYGFYEQKLPYRKNGAAISLSSNVFSSVENV
jgi:hypothetical protein